MKKINMLYEIFYTLCIIIVYTTLLVIAINNSNNIVGFIAYLGVCMIFGYVFGKARLLYYKNNGYDYLE